jgi:hypothetical protein
MIEVQSSFDVQSQDPNTYPPSNPFRAPQLISRGFIPNLPGTPFPSNGMPECISLSTECTSMIKNSSHVPAISALVFQTSHTLRLMTKGILTLAPMDGEVQVCNLSRER